LEEMAAKQDTYTCSLITICEKARNGEKMTVDAGTRFECPEGKENCGAKMVKSGGGVSIPKWAYGAAAAVLLVLAAVFLLPGGGDGDVLAEQTPPISPVSPEPTTDVVEALHTELSKVGDNVNLSMPERQQMVEPTLRNYFTTEQTPYVKRVGENGTLIETLTAEEYLNRLSGLITLSQLEVVDALQDSQGKVREIIVREVHQTSLN
jgi:hypothetical protein